MIFDIISFEVCHWFVHGHPTNGQVYKYGALAVGKWRTDTENNGWP